MKVYQFDSRRLGPVPMILGSVFAISLAIGLLILASMFAVFFMVAGLVLATISGIAFGVRRFLRGRATSDELGEHIATITEVSQREGLNEADGIKEVQVEVVETHNSQNQ